MLCKTLIRLLLMVLISRDHRNQHHYGVSFSQTTNAQLVAKRSAPTLSHYRQPRLAIARFIINPHVDEITIRLQGSNDDGRMIANSCTVLETV